MEAGANGGVYAFGNAGFWGSIQSVNSGQTAQSWLGTPIIGVAEVPGGGGYWLAGDNGEVCGFGSATVWSYDGGPAEQLVCTRPEPLHGRNHRRDCRGPQRSGLLARELSRRRLHEHDQWRRPLLRQRGEHHRQHGGHCFDANGRRLLITTTVGAVYTQGTRATRVG